MLSSLTSVFTIQYIYTCLGALIQVEKSKGASHS